MLARFISILVIFLGISAYGTPIKKNKLPKKIQAVQLSVIPWDVDTYEFDLVFDLSKQAIKGNLIEREKGYSGEENRILAQCEFTKSLNSVQVRKIKSLLSRLIYCAQPGSPEVISESMYKEAFIAYTKNPSIQQPDGQGLFLDKYFDDSNEISRYLCQGHEELYGYLQDLTDATAPATCPASYKMMFEF